MTIPHDTLREQLLDLAYGELGRREARAVRAHLETCAACRAELSRMNATRSAMSGLGSVPAPERGEDVLLAAARGAARARVRKPFLPSWAWGASIGAVSAAAVLVLTLKLAPGLRSPGEPPSDALVSSSPSRHAAPAPSVAEPAPPPGAESGGGAGKDADARGEAKAERPALAKEREPPAKPRDEGRGEVARGRSAEERPLGEPGPATPSEPEPLSADEADRFADREAAPPPSATAPAAPAPHGGRSPDAEGPRVARRERAEPAARPAEAPPAAALAESAEAAEERGLRAKQAAPGAAGKGKPRALSRAVEDPLARHARLALAGALRTATRTFPDCPGETSRAVESDAAGRVVKVDRRGVAAGRSFLLEQWYGEDGALSAVRWSSDGRVHELRLDPGALAGAPAAAIPAFALEPRSAADAGVDAPPRCGD